MCPGLPARLLRLTSPGLLQYWYRYYVVLTHPDRNTQKRTQGNAGNASSGAATSGLGWQAGSSAARLLASAIPAACSGDAGGRQVSAVALSVLGWCVTGQVAAEARSGTSCSRRRPEKACGRRACRPTQVRAVTTAITSPPSAPSLGWREPGG